MKLLYSLRSPFARKVRVVLREKGLYEVEEVAVDPQENGPELLALNPLGKVPALQTDRGSFYDSPVVCEYLDSLSFHVPLLPADPAMRLEVLRLQALADGIMDAAVAIVVERRRPEPQRSPHWLARWTSAIERSVSELARWPLPRQFDLGAVATACALDYLTFRCPEIAWSEREPKLAVWAQPHLMRRSMQETTPTWS